MTGYAKLLFLKPSSYVFRADTAHNFPNWWPCMWNYIQFVHSKSSNVLGEKTVCGCKVQCYSRAAHFSVLDSENSLLSDEYQLISIGLSSPERCQHLTGSPAWKGRYRTSWSIWVLFKDCGLKERYIMWYRNFRSFQSRPQCLSAANRFVLPLHLLD